MSPVVKSRYGVFISQPDRSDVWKPSTIRSFKLDAWPECDAYAFDEFNLAIEGSRFATQDQAFEEGKLVHQQLSATIANTGVAVDFDPPPLPERNEGDGPESPDAPGLHVFPTPERLTVSPRFIADGQPSQPIDRIINQDLAAVRQVIPNGLASQLKDTYSGKEPADYFKTVYTVRSRIVHGVHDYDGKNKRPTTQDIKAANPELQRFATDLLKAESAKPAE